MPEQTHFKYFKLNDFNCQETGTNGMDIDFIHKLDALRHSKTTKGGTHTLGIAADISVNGGRQRMQIVKQAAAMGFNGIGVAKHFVHVDTRDGGKSVLWCY